MAKLKPLDKAFPKPLIKHKDGKVLCITSCKVNMIYPPPPPDSFRGQYSTVDLVGSGKDVDEAWHDLERMVKLVKGTDFKSVGYSVGKPDELKPNTGNNSSIASEPDSPKLGFII